MEFYLFKYHIGSSTLKFRLKIYLLLFLSGVSSLANSAWHGGTIKQINVGYDGKTITLIPDGWVRDNCTCYPSWPNTMCLDPTRETASFERSMVMSVRARGVAQFFYIDETSCLVKAMYEYN